MEGISMGDFFMDKIHFSESGKKYLSMVAIVLSVYFAMKYVSPVVSPFVLAFLLVGFINPIVTRLHSRIKIKKSILTGIMIFLLCALILLALWGLGVALFSGGKNLASQMPEFQEDMLLLLQNCCDRMESRFGIDGIVIENFVLEQADVLAENLEVNVFPALMGKSFDAMKIIGACVSFLVVMLIAVLLIIKDYDRVMGRLIEEESLRGAIEVCVKVVVYVKTFVKAQLVILCIISGICALTLGLVGMKGGVVYGLITGFMDLLPFIGTGIMLIPLAIVMLLQGSYFKAIVCLCLYGVCALMREFLEPKLIGDKVGVWPVGILLAVFAGIKLFGIAGIIKGPLALVIICEICKYLWKAEKDDIIFQPEKERERKDS